MRIAVTGKKGQVVSCLLERGQLAGIEIVTVGRPELDLTAPASVLAALSAVRPDVVVSAAAYTAVDRAESEADLAFSVNAEGPAAIAKVTVMLGIPVIHLSTDYVFPGDKLEAHVETDATAPMSIYGRSKLAGEASIAAANPNHAILRTGWVYSPFGTNFIKTMLRLAESRDVVDVVADQQGTPTSALDIADAVIAIARRLAVDTNPCLRGIFHLTASGCATWADFAEAIFEYLTAQGGKVVSVRRIATFDYPATARRPANSCLSNDKLRNVHGIILPDWKASIPVVVDRLVQKHFSVLEPSLEET